MVEVASKIKNESLPRNAARDADAQRAPQQRSRRQGVERGEDRVRAGVAKPRDRGGVEPLRDHPRASGVVRRFRADDARVLAAQHVISDPCDPVAFRVVRMREKCEEQQ